MELKKNKKLSNEEANAYISSIQGAVSDLLNIANEQVNQIEREIQYRDETLCSTVFTDYEVIKQLKTFTSLTIEV